MIENANQVRQDETEPLEEDDPLLELARIVSGEEAVARPVPTQTPPVSPFQSRATPTAPPMEAFEQPVPNQGPELVAPDASFGQQPVHDGSSVPTDDVFAQQMLDSMGEGQPLAASQPPVSQFETPLPPFEPGAPQFEPQQPEFISTPPVATPTPPAGYDASLEDSLEQQLMEELMEAPVSEPAAVLANTDVDSLIPDPMPAVEEFIPEAPIEPIPVAETQPSVGEFSQPQIDTPVASAPIPSFSPAVPETGLQGSVVPDPAVSAPVVSETMPGDLARGNPELGDPVGSELSPEPFQANDLLDSADLEADLGEMFAAEFDQITAGQPDEIVLDSQNQPVLNSPTNTHFSESPGENNPSDGAVDDIDLDLEAEFGAAFEASAQPDSLEAEFASAFNDELLQNDVLPGQGGDNIASTQSNFDPTADFALNNGAPPTHLDDPAMLDAPEDLMAAEENEERGGTGIKMAAVALGVALFAGLGAVSYGYMNGPASETGPIIVKANTDPIKVKPADPGGRKVANQDKASFKEVAGEVEESNQTALLSATETVQPIRVETEAPKPDGKASERLGVQESTESATAIVQPTMTPRRVKTFTVKPDGTIIAPQATTSEPAVENEVAELQPTPLEPVANTRSLANDVQLAQTEVSEPEVLRVDGAISTGAIALPVPSPLPKPVARKSEPKPAEPVQIADLNDGGGAQTAPSSAWVVQISSQRSRAAAQSSLKNLRSRFGSVLSGRQTNIREAKVAGKGTFYRVRVNSQSKADAQRFCTRFKSAGGSCFVTR